MKRKTQEEFEKEIEKEGNGEYIVIGAYKNAITPCELFHKTCGKSYSPLPNNFLKKGQRCSHCAGNKAYTEEEYIQMINSIDDDYEFVSFETKFTNIHSRIILKHKVCNKTYSVDGNCFKNKDRCPFCAHKTENMTDGEVRVSKYLESKSIEYTFQYPYNYDPEDGRHTVLFDFFININGNIIIIEYDGIFHFEPKHGKDKLARQQELDKMKDKYCIDNNIDLIRIPYLEYERIEEILDERLSKYFND